VTIVCVCIFHVKYRLTLHILNECNELRQEHCSYTTDWLASVLLVKLARWSQELHLNIETLSLRLVDIESYSVTYERLKEKYGSYLVSVSNCIICLSMCFCL